MPHDKFPHVELLDQMQTRLRKEAIEIGIDELRRARLLVSLEALVDQEALREHEIMIKVKAIAHAAHMAELYARNEEPTHPCAVVINLPTGAKWSDE